MFVAVYHRVGQLLRGKWSSRSWITQGYQKPFVFLCFMIKSPKLRRYLNGHLGAPSISLDITLTQVKMCFHRNIWTVQRCTQAVTYFIISQTNRVLQRLFAAMFALTQFNEGESFRNIFLFLYLALLLSLLIDWEDDVAQR